MAYTWTLLALAQEFCGRANLQTPAYVTTSQDEEVIQIWKLLNEEITELAERGDWPELHRNFSFVHANQDGYLALNLFGPAAANMEQSGLVPGATGVSIKYPSKCTLWSSTMRTPVAGPLSDQEWTTMLALDIVPAVYSWRMSNAGICIYPVPDPVADTSFMLDAQIREPVVSSNLLTYHELFTQDSDISLLPGRVMMAGIRWRWAMQKGLPYAELQRSYEGMLMQVLGNGIGAAQIRLDDDATYPQIVRPGLLIAAGNWTNLT